jgi:hypothetical protein
MLRGEREKIPQNWFHAIHGRRRDLFLFLISFSFFHSTARGVGLLFTVPGSRTSGESFRALNAFVSSARRRIE